MDDPGSRLGSDAWRFPPLGWMLLWGFTAVLSAGSLALFPPSGTPRLVLACAAVGLALACFGFLALRLARGDECGDGPLLVLVLLWCAALALAPTVWIGAAPISMLVYSVAPKRRGHLSSGLFAAFGSIGILTLPDGPGLLVRAAFAATAAAYSLGLGWWVARVVAESHERKELLLRLEETQSQLAEVNHERGALAERQRLARDIHDTLAQGFTSVRMLVEAAQAKLDKEPERARHHLELARRTAAENHTQARALAMEGVAGRPESSLPNALRNLAEGLWEQRTDVAVRGAPRTLTTVQEVALLRAAQESVANVRKHSQAEHVSITLDYRPEQVVLTVRDDGVGFDPSRVDGGGLGLTGMRDRLAELEGRVELCSRPGMGTSVTVSVAQ
ncbi:sensor histidine kinase [Allosalinactinospora lopnorensis]|uniref:sensor histidine kinase n=1 Tax=Allosalinactinospora lopnorensis TaxID=1352348 RepID=UPI00069728E0|nr:sensor histidine kinase [Allosalinactinospora lopnorensis]